MFCSSLLWCWTCSSCHFLVRRVNRDGFPSRSAKPCASKGVWFKSSALRLMDSGINRCYVDSKTENLIRKFVSQFKDSCEERNLVDECTKYLLRCGPEAELANYVVARGAKPVWDLGGIPARTVEELLLIEKIFIGGMGIILGKRSDEIVSCIPVIFTTKWGGFISLCIAAQQHIADTYKWLLDNQPNLPRHIFESLRGQMLGYDAISIQKFIDTRCDQK